MSAIMLYGACDEGVEMLKGTCVICKRDRVNYRGGEWYSEVLGLGVVEGK